MIVNIDSQSSKINSDQHKQDIYMFQEGHVF